MPKSLLLYVNIIEGVVQENPVPIYFNREKVTPVGIKIIRYFDFNECSLASKAFIIGYENQTFGTWQFKSWEDYWQWFYSGGAAASGYFLLNGGYMLLNGSKTLHNIS